MLPVAGWDSAKLVQKFLYVPNSFLITLRSAKQNCGSLKTYVCTHSGSSMQKGNLEAKWQTRRACLFPDKPGLPGPESVGLTPPRQGEEKSREREAGIQLSLKVMGLIQGTDTCWNTGDSGRYLHPLHKTKNFKDFVQLLLGWITSTQHWPNGPSPLCAFDYCVVFFPNECRTYC